jgi:hypothetical protein
MGIWNLWTRFRAETLESKWWRRWSTSTYSYERWDIQNGLELRYSLLEFATRRLSASIANTGLMDADKTSARASSIPPLCVWQLATIDVFVEKAQHFLTERADRQQCYGVIAMLVTFLTMVFAIFLAFIHYFFGETPTKLAPDEYPKIIPFLHFLEFLTVLAPIFGIAYFSTSLARAFFHEATILRNRRHSVRLGRLLLHLKVSSARSADGLAKIIEGLDITEVERSFGWNLETSTAFKDINPESMTTGLIPQLIAAVRTLSEIGKERKEGKAQSSEKS